MPALKKYLPEYSEKSRELENGPFFGVDYYGVPNLCKKIKTFGNEAMFISVMMLDSLFASAAFEYLPYLSQEQLRALLPRRAFIINTYNLFSAPEANISRTQPSVFLGLIGAEWNRTDLAILKKFTTEYLKEFMEILSAFNEATPERCQDFLTALNQDPHLNKPTFDFETSLGLKVDPKAWKTVWQVLTAFAAKSDHMRNSR